MGVEFQFCEVRTVLEIDSRDDCATGLMYLMPRNGVL